MNEVEDNYKIDHNIEILTQIDLKELKFVDQNEALRLFQSN